MSTDSFGDPKIRPHPVVKVPAAQNSDVGKVCGQQHIHIAYERFRLKNSSSSAALRVASAVALGAFGLAVGANIHSLSTGLTNRLLLLSPTLTFTGLRRGIGHGAAQELPEVAQPTTTSGLVAGFVTDGRFKCDDVVVAKPPSQP
jgi:hypothetical protein